MADDSPASSPAGLEGIAAALRGGRLIDMYLLGTDVMMSFLVHSSRDCEGELKNFIIKSQQGLDILEPLGNNRAE